MKTVQPEEGAKPKVFPTDRKCTDCGVVLSKYNTGDKCWSHGIKPKRRRSRKCE